MSEEQNTPEVPEVPVEVNPLEVFDVVEHQYESEVRDSYTNGMHNINQKPGDKLHETIQEKSEIQNTPESEGRNEGEAEIQEEGEEVGPAKALEFKAGENALSVPLDAKVAVKVNGQIQEVTLDQLRSGYAGEVGYSKKFQELDTQMKQREAQVLRSQQEVTEIVDYIKELPELVKSGNPYKALERLYEIADQDGSHSKMELFEAFLKQAQGVAASVDKLTPEQIEAIKAQKQLEQEKGRLEKERKILDVQRQKRELESHIVGLQKKFNVPDDILQEYWQNFSTGKVPISMEGVNPADKKAVIERVVKYAATDLELTRIADILDSVKPGAGDDAKTVEQFFKLTAGKSNSDIKEIAQEYFGTTRNVPQQPAQLAREPQRKEAPSARLGVEPAVSSRDKQKADEKKAYLSFDDILEEYGH